MMLRGLAVALLLAQPSIAAAMDDPPTKNEADAAHRREQTNAIMATVEARVVGNAAQQAREFSNMMNEMDGAPPPAFARPGVKIAPMAGIDNAVEAAVAERAAQREADQRDLEARTFTGAFRAAWREGDVRYLLRQSTIQYILIMLGVLLLVSLGQRLFGRRR